MYKNFFEKSLYMYMNWRSERFETTRSGRYAPTRLDVRTSSTVYDHTGRPLVFAPTNLTVNANPRDFYVPSNQARNFPPSDLTITGSNDTYTPSEQNLTFAPTELNLGNPRTVTPSTPLSPDSWQPTTLDLGITNPSTTTGSPTNLEFKPTELEGLDSLSGTEKPQVEADEGVPSSEYKYDTSRVAKFASVLGTTGIDELEGITFKEIFNGGSNLDPKAYVADIEKYSKDSNLPSETDAGYEDYIKKSYQLGKFRQYLYAEELSKLFADGVDTRANFVIVEKALDQALGLSSDAEKANNPYTAEMEKVIIPEIKRMIAAGEIKDLEIKADWRSQLNNSKFKEAARAAIKNVAKQNTEGSYSRMMNKYKEFKLKQYQEFFKNNPSPTVQQSKQLLSNLLNEGGLGIDAYEALELIQTAWGKSEASPVHKELEKILKANNINSKLPGANADSRRTYADILKVVDNPGSNFQYVPINDAGVQKLILGKSLPTADPTLP